MPLGHPGQERVIEPDLRSAIHRTLAGSDARTRYASCGSFGSSYSSLGLADDRRDGFGRGAADEHDADDEAAESGLG